MLPTCYGKHNATVCDFLLLCCILLKSKARALRAYEIDWVLSDGTTTRQAVCLENVNRVRPTAD